MLLNIGMSDDVVDLVSIHASIQKILLNSQIS